MDKEFYDLCYEEWMRGGNPDDLQEDAYDHMKDSGYYPDEIRPSDIGGKSNQTLY
jgi:hypothetical protein